MINPRQALATLLEAGEDGRLEALCDRFGLDLVSVFGSTLDSGVPDPSDLDLGVRFGRKQEQDVVGLVIGLTQLLGLDAIDVMVLNGAGPVARARALGAGARGIYERRRGDYALAQMAALAEEMETAPMRRRDLELLAGR